MKLNSKVTGGLAWAGLAIVLAVPTANLLTQTDGERVGVAVAPKAPLAVANSKADVVAPVPAVRKTQTVAKTPTVDKIPVVTREASVVTKAPVVRSTVKSDDPVEEFIASGKELPSYISDVPATAEASTKTEVKKPVVLKAPLPTVVAAVPVETDEVRADGTLAREIDPIEVASVDKDTPVTRIFRPSLVAPIPYPLTLRPTAETIAAAKARVVTTPRDLTVATEKPLVIDEDVVARREALVDEVLSEEFDPVGSEADIVRGEELEEWDSGSLAEYLERRNMISKSRSDEQVSAEPDEFVIVDRSRAERRVVRRLRDDERDFF